jgi:hypothetical protein
MFGIAAFSEVPFSSLPTSGGIWQEVRGDSNVWTSINPTEPSFLVKDSNGVQYQASLIVLSSSAVQFVVPREVKDSSGTTFVPVTNLWQDSSTSSSSWVEV